jgi:hypothetical protein
MLRRFVWLVGTVTALGCATIGCASGDADDDLEATEDPLARGSNADRWVYNGVLPHLEEPSIVVAQTPHTARITGFLPAGFDRNQLPFYADAIDEGGRTKVAIVYPIATGSSVNHQPNDYATERVFPRRTDSTAPWGGFPFISYTNDESSMKGIAFHGPITARDGDWRLIRGPVSHGCNRMQGEHVVELAHLIGVEMTTKVWSGNTVLRDIRVPVKVLRGSPDTWQGQNVDVDYPAHASVRRPTENVRMFRAWRSDDFPAWVCKLDKGAPMEGLPSDYCASVRGLKNSRDARTGN